MGKTTISVEEATLDRFKEAKAEMDAAEPGVPDMNADLFLQCLLDTHDKVQEHGYGDKDDEITATVRPEVDEDALADIEERMDEAFGDAGAGLTYDDVVQATRKALREELPDEVLGR